MIPQHNYLKLPKFGDIVHLQNCLFMNEIKQNEKLAKSFSELKYCSYILNDQTRSVTRKLLNISYVKTDAYGTQSAKYHCIIDWNNFKEIFSNLSPDEHRNSKTKVPLKKLFLNKYWSSLEKQRKTSMPWNTSVFSSQTLLFFRTIIYYYYHK